MEGSERFIVVDPIMNSEFSARDCVLHIKCVESLAAVSTGDNKL